MVGPIEIEDETELETDEHGDPTRCTAYTACQHPVARGLVVCQCCVDSDAERCAFTLRREAVEKLIAHFKLSDTDAQEVRRIAGV
jgi:hypothetical protein